MTNRLEKVGLLAVVEGASKFISDVRSTAAEQAKLEQALQKTAATSAKTSGSMSADAQRVQRAIAAFTDQIAKNEKVVETSHLAAAKAADVQATALKNLAAVNVQPRTAAGQFAAKAPLDVRQAASAAADTAGIARSQAIIEEDRATQRLAISRERLQQLKVLPTGAASDLAKLLFTESQLSTETEKAASSHSKLAGQLLNLAKAAAIAFVSYKALSIIKNVITDTADLGTATFKLQQEIGGTAEQISGLIFAARQFGIEPQKLATALGIFNRNLALVEENARGLNTRGQQSTRVFAALGISVLDANKNLRPTLDVLSELADKFAASTDETLKSGIAEQLFGQNTIELLPLLNQGSAGIDKLIARAKELGVTFTDEGARSAFAFTQSQRELGGALKGLEVQIGQDILPILTEFTQKLTDFVSKNRGAITAAVKDLATGIGSNVLLGLKQLNQLLSFLPANERVISAAILAIGAALITAFGPEAAWLIGLTFLVTHLEQIEHVAAGGTFSKFPTERDRLVSRQTALQKELDTNQVPGIPSGGRIGTSTPLAGAAAVEKFFTALGVGVDKVRDRTKVEQELAQVTAAIAKIDQDAADAEKQKSDAEKEKARTDELGKLSLDAIDAAEKKEIETLHDLAQAFEKTSQEAGQVKSLTSDLTDAATGARLFGEVSKDLADKLGLSATQAGNVQGIDAAIEAQKRGEAEAFNYTEALATVAEAFSQNASVAQDIVLALARSALEASQAAAQAVFARPTREVADLNVSLAQQRLSGARLAQSTDPQLSSLNAQVRAIDRQLAEIGRSNSRASQAAQVANRQVHEDNRAIAASNRQAATQAREAARQRSEAKKSAEQAAQAAEDGVQAQLDQLKLANLIAQVAYERINANLERLISADQKQASDLQEAFRKSNDDLQQQINAAIGKGDVSGALSLAERQRAEAKNFQAQEKALTKQEQNTKFQQEQLKLANDERERSARLAEAQAEAQAAATKRQIKSTNEVSDALDAQTDSLGDQTQATEDTVVAVKDDTSSLEDSRQALQDQIDSLTDSTTAEKDKEKVIQDSIDVFQAQTDVLKAQVDAADKTLLTQKQQADITGTLVKQIGIESQAVVDLTDKTNKGLIPQVDAATEKFNLMQDALKVLADPTFRDSLIATRTEGFDPLTERADILAKAAETTADTVRRLGIESLTASGKIAAAGDRVEKAAADIKTDSGKKDSGSTDSLLKKILDKLGHLGVGVGIGGIGAHAIGGLVTRPTFSLLGEGFRAEAILPLTQPARSQEILRSLPAGTLAAILPQRQQVTIGSLFGSMSAQGMTLSDLEPAVHRMVSNAFRQAAITSKRHGGVLTQGVGAGT